MSKPTEEMSTTLSEEKSSEPSVDATDEIAELLVDEIKPKEEDIIDDENQTDLSNLSKGESDELSDDADPDKKGEAEGDPTWENILGVTEGDLNFDEEGNIVGFNTKVNGESEIISTKDLLAGFQNNKSFTQKSQAHAEAVKEFEVQKKQVQQVYASKLESVDALVSHFEKQLISEYDNVDWNTMRSENPAEYAAAKSDFSEKASGLQRIQEAIIKDRETQNQEVQESQIAAQQTYAKQQFDLMIDKNPEWKDEKVRDEAKSSFKTFVNDNYGFTDQEFETVFDARLIELIKDAKRFHDASKVSDKKRQKPVPKFQKSVGGNKKASTKLDQLTAASKKAHGEQKRELQKSAVAELLLGNI